jgi:hypothetical protein
MNDDAFDVAKLFSSNSEVCEIPKAEFERLHSLGNR